MTTLQITLPDSLALEAQRAGLLSPPQIEKLLRKQLQSQRAAAELRAAMDRMDAVDGGRALSPEEVVVEIHAMRKERRAGRPGK